MNNDRPFTPYSSVVDSAECKGCGSRAMITSRAAAQGLLYAAESRSWLCGICGDEWVVSKRTLVGGTELTYYHTPQWPGPLLARTALLDLDPDSSGMMDEESVAWSYELGHEPVREDAWRAELARRRRALKARIAN